MNAVSTAPAGKGRRQLVMLIALFLLPPIAAYLAWQYVSEHGVGATTNHGTFISPPRPLALDQLTGTDGEPLDVSDIKGRWLYVVLAKGGCDARCESQLFLTRQTRIGVNKDMPRVRRLLITDQALDAQLAATLAEQHPRLLVAQQASGSEVMSKFQGAQYAGDGAQFFLVDPMGNLMMFYSEDVQPKGLLRDLQKLLKTSQVG